MTSPGLEEHVPRSRHEVALGIAVRALLRICTPIDERYDLTSDFRTAKMALDKIRAILPEVVKP